MSGEQTMPKVDMVKDIGEIKKPQLDYIRQLEKSNFERVNRLRTLRKRNIMTSFLLGGGVLGIYLYSIFSVKQETFLDTLDEKD